MTVKSARRARGAVHAPGLRGGRPRVFVARALVLSFALFGLGATRLLEAWALHGRSYSGLMGKAFGLKGVYLCRVTIVLQPPRHLPHVRHLRSRRTAALLWAYWTGATPTLATCCALQLLVLVPLSWIRDMQTFATTNLIANALILYA